MAWRISYTFKSKLTSVFLKLGVEIGATLVVGRFSIYNTKIF